MSNPYRIRSTDLFSRLDDNLNESPRSIVFIAVEGNDTEYDYFRYVDKYRQRLGINKLVRIEAVKRANADTKSDPLSVLDLLCEIVDLHNNGVDVSKMQDVIPDGYTLDFVERYINEPDSLQNDVRLSFRRKMLGKGLDAAYLKFISECDSRHDSFCIILDRDTASHSIQQLKAVENRCHESGYGFFLASPCFEFWLLLHLCNVRNEYANCMDMLVHNHKVSSKHTFVSREVQKKAGHSKHISEVVFCNKYLDSIEEAIKQAGEFESDLSNLMSENSLGTNIQDIFKLLLES